ncbi:MAG: OmpA family protein [Parasphingorhabdus sp.]|uniref:OmpA family protein n=1 Tax=Parasphingorhabdus sp. TaxID=2709688 RepID=UPI003001E9C0
MRDSVMEVEGKILTGIAATALLALVGHYGTGDKYISGLENTVKTELTAQGMDSVNVSFAHSPLSRKAVLDGDVSDEVKQKALNAVSEISGVSSAVWVGNGVLADTETSIKAGDGGKALDPAAQTVVKKCQASVDKAMEGKKLSFRSGSAYVSPASNKLLDEVAAALKPCSGLTIDVGGHTDGAGNAEVNKILSQERADRVRAGLIERGIAENLVTSTGYGAERPLAKGRGAEADAQNRRIELKARTADAKTSNNENSQQGE